jgi:hypothetical protein
MRLVAALASVVLLRRLLEEPDRDVCMTRGAVARLGAEAMRAMTRFASSLMRRLGQHRVALVTGRATFEDAVALIVGVVAGATVAMLHRAL